MGRKNGTNIFCEQILKTSHTGIHRGSNRQHGERLCGDIGNDSERAATHAQQYRDARRRLFYEMKFSAKTGAATCLR